MTINLDFTGLADVDPYVNADFDNLATPPKILTGRLVQGGFGTANIGVLRYNGVMPTTGKHRIKLTQSRDSNASSDNAFLYMIDAAGDGFGARINGIGYDVFQVVEGDVTSNTEYISSVDQTHTASDVFELEYDLDANTLQMFFNNVARGNVTAATLTGLAPGVGIVWNNAANARGITTAEFTGLPVASPNPVLTDTLLDAEASNAPLINQTNLSVHVYDTDGGTLLYSTAVATTDANGVFVIDDDLVGTVGDTVFVIIKPSAGRPVCGTMTVTDGNA